jgi:integrase
MTEIVENSGCIISFPTVAATAVPKIKGPASNISIEDVIEILNVCDNIRLRTYVILLAATGMRAVEALSIRIKDIDFDSNPAKVFVRGEYTKTKVDRIIFLTEERTQQLKSWLEYKHRTRRVCHQDKQKGKTITEYRTPDKKDTDLVFAVYHDKNTPNPDSS